MAIQSVQHIRYYYLEFRSRMGPFPRSTRMSEYDSIAPRASIHTEVDGVLSTNSFRPAAPPINMILLPGLRKLHGSSTPLRQDHFSIDCSDELRFKLLQKTIAYFRPSPLFSPGRTTDRMVTMVDAGPCQQTKRREL
jgi:hypothetical protein